MTEPARYAIVPTRNRHAYIVHLAESLREQKINVVVLDNGSDPPLDGRVLGVDMLTDPEQPPNVARFWNLLFDRVAKLAAAAGAAQWDVAVLNDDALIPAGWFDITATALRRHGTAVAAHTGAGPRFRSRYLLTELDNDFRTRLCPHAFIVRGEVGLRADESMRWWFFDTDFDWQAREAGGVLCVPGPRTANALANASTVAGLWDQAQADQDTFMAKWPGRLVPIGDWSPR